MTYGWYGKREGHVLYYSHFTEHHLIEENQIPETSQFFKFLALKLLGKE